MYSGGPISWSSKKQSVIALSSTEAEYVSVTHSIQEGIWIRSSLEQVGFPEKSSTPLKVDNNGAISLTSNGMNHSCSKHIDVKFHFIQSHVENGKFLPTYVKTAKNTADIFTKPLAHATFESHIQGLGLITDHGGV
jgi:hypothetical protein